MIIQYSLAALIFLFSSLGEIQTFSSRPDEPLKSKAYTILKKQISKKSFKKLDWSAAVVEKMNNSDSAGAGLVRIPVKDHPEKTLFFASVNNHEAYNYVEFKDWKIKEERVFCDIVITSVTEKFLGHHIVKSNMVGFPEQRDTTEYADPFDIEDEAFLSLTVIDSVKNEKEKIFAYSLYWLFNQDKFYDDLYDLPIQNLRSHTGIIFVNPFLKPFKGVIKLHPDVSPDMSHVEQ